MPFVYGFAAYGFTGLVLLCYNHTLDTGPLTYFAPDIELSIREMDKQYVKQNWARHAQKTKIYVGLIVLGITAFACEQHNRDVIFADSAKHYTGETKWVCGIVSQIKRVREGKDLIDFGNPYPKQTFTAVFTPQAYREVLQEQGQIEIGDSIGIHGKIDLYDGCPEFGCLTNRMSC